MNAYIHAHANTYIRVTTSVDARPPCAQLSLTIQAYSYPYMYICV